MAVDRNHVPLRAILEARKRMNDAIRRWFDRAGMLEVETPIAVPSPGLEPHLFAFETEQQHPDGEREKLYLHTSPEYAMKRMLGRGLGSIYQLARVFRNGERSSTHAGEFTMLEWYRCPGTMAELMDDTEALIAEVADAVEGPWRPLAIERLSVSEAFLRAALADPIEHPDREELRRALSVREVEGDTWEDIFFRAFLERVEPTFSENAITILYGYPASMAALARLDAKDPRVAERFEVYLGRMELANAFGELTDPIEQRRRFEVDREERRKRGLPAYPIDEGFLEDLARIETAAGIALGVDRLLMRCLGLARIQDAIAFSPRDAG
jgi:lysyl-tRNA synthetase class 2